MTEHDSSAVEEIHRALHDHLPSEPALRVKALQSLLVEKGMIDTKTIDAWIEVFTEEIGPMRGARVVARAWTDPEFRASLLEDGAEAFRVFDFSAATTAHLVVVENTAKIHNLIVCTLCSCYPMTLLGIPPNWYKSAAYRSKAVRRPEAVLNEFGVDLDPDVEIRVWDSTAEVRYFVLPQRPPGTEGWDEGRLAQIVTRNAMIGTQRDLSVQT